MAQEVELVTVRTVQELHDNLQKLIKNSRHIESFTVDHASAEIKVDLSRIANGFGNPDFRMKLRSSKTMEAAYLLERLKNETDVSRTQAEELFEMLQTGP